MSSKSKHINTLRRYTAILFLLFFSSIETFGQQENNPFIKSFTANAKNGSIYLSWTTRAGFTCQDIHIYVSRDSLLGYERRGTYFGMCGDTSEKQYTYLLENTFLNERNFIKLELGTVGYSNTISLVVLKLNNSILILPHPVVSSSTIYYENKEQTLYTLSVYDINGNVFLETQTRDEKINIGSFLLPTGVFYLDLYAPQKQRYSSKIVVL